MKKLIANNKVKIYWLYYDGLNKKTHLKLLAKKTQLN